MSWRKQIRPSVCQDCGAQTAGRGPRVTCDRCGAARQRTAKREHGRRRTPRYCIECGATITRASVRCLKHAAIERARKVRARAVQEVGVLEARTHLDGFKLIERWQKLP